MADKNTLTWNLITKGISIFLFLTTFILFGSAKAQFDAENGNNVIIRANTLFHDKNRHIVTATGQVEIVVGTRVLLADRVTYLLINDTISAEGNISLLEESGTVFFADYLELTDQMRNGVIRSFKALLKNEARFAAESAERLNGNRIEMHQAIYSPCKICEHQKKHAPLWQLRAKKIIHDQKKKQVIYQRAVLEIRGLPIFYTPYFSHPDSTVERKTGFLMPTQGHSTQLGTTLQIPFFINLSSNMDATIDAKLTSKEGPVLSSEFRHKTNNGFYTLDGSITRPEKRDDNNVGTGKRRTRSHFFSSGSFSWNETWRWGFNGAITSDDTYLRRYKISNSDTLVNRIFVEGFSGRNYASSNIYFFQGLRADDDPGERPLIFPLLDHKYVGEPNDSGLIFKLSSNFLHLTRKEGIDSTRLSFRGGWYLPSTSRLGDHLTLSLEFKADGYITNDVPKRQNPNSSNSSDFLGRLVPQLSGEWRWPLVKKEKKSQQVIEPIINFAVSPYGGNPGNIPNEDSQSFEFDDTNVFTANRFPGLDRIEGGPRLNLGFKYGIYGDQGGSINALLGQVFRLKSDDTFAERTGLEEKRSDYVGRLSLSPGSWLKYYQRFRLDRDTLSLRRNEITADLGSPTLRLGLTYLSLSRELTAEELTDREEIAALGRAKLSKYWSLTGHTRHDLTNEGGTINAGTGLEYTDECFSFIFDFDRNFTRDREIQPNTTITVRIRLTNLG